MDQRQLCVSTATAAAWHARFKRISVHSVWMQSTSISTLAIGDALVATLTMLLLAAFTSKTYLKEKMSVLSVIRLA